MNNKNEAICVEEPVVFIGRPPQVLLEQAVWLYGGATNIFSAFCSLFGFSSSRRITPSNRINNELLVINLAAVTGGRFSMPVLRKYSTLCVMLFAPVFKNK